MHHRHELASNFSFSLLLLLLVIIIIIIIVIITIIIVIINNTIIIIIIVIVIVIIIVIVQDLQKHLTGLWRTHQQQMMQPVVYNLSTTSPKPQ